MSVIGPRPGLWNQDFLTAERDKYGANDIKPGLTGWAQINGRDEIEIPVKAKLDGEYAQKMGPLMDMYDYLVVGSGLYGAVFAQQAKAAGKSVLVIDKRPNIAGNVYTEKVEGINFHKYGAHIFHTNNTKV